MSNRDKVLTLGRLVVAAAEQLMGSMWEEKGTFTSNGRYFLTLAVKLVPVLSTPDKRGNLYMPVGMALLCCYTPRHPGVVEEDTVGLPQPRVITILCSMYSHVSGCR